MSANETNVSPMPLIKVSYNWLLYGVDLPNGYRCGVSNGKHKGQRILKKVAANDAINEHCVT